MEVEVSDALIGVGQKSPFCNMLVLSPDGRTDGRTDRQTDTHTHTHINTGESWSYPANADIRYIFVQNCLD